MQESSFKNFILDQLAELEGVRARCMFGSYGLYCGRKFFGIVSKGVFKKYEPANRQEKKCFEDLSTLALQGSRRADDLKEELDRADRVYTLNYIKFDIVKAVMQAFFGMFLKVNEGNRLLEEKRGFVQKIHQRLKQIIDTNRYLKFESSLSEDKIFCMRLITKMFAFAGAAEDLAERFAGTSSSEIDWDLLHTPQQRQIDDIVINFFKKAKDEDF